jgi:PEP-CTERM motif-containing protein
VQGVGLAGEGKKTRHRQSATVPRLVGGRQRWRFRDRRGNRWPSPPWTETGPARNTELKSPTYADGLAVGGNVTANWTVLTDLVVQGPSGMTFMTLPDDSVLAGDDIPGQGFYGVTGVTDLSGITGIRLEILKDPSLPAGGPGFYLNGNFVLTELELATIPEPATLTLLGLAFGVMGLASRRRLH